MSGYRKTARRQRLRGPFLRPDITRDAHRRPRALSWPPVPAGDVATTFMLPPMLAFAVAPGRHGVGVTVNPAGLVEIAGRSREHVIQLAADFFAVVARERLPFTVAAIIGDRGRPEERDVYQVTVVGGHVVASRCALSPEVVALRSNDRYVTA
jgi:hypothetical protein